MWNYLYSVNFTIYEEVIIQLLLSDALWQVPDPEFSNSQVRTIAFVVLAATGAQVLVFPGLMANVRR